jgi:hypothetical protein
MIYHNKNVIDIKHDLKPHDILISCYAPQREPGTDLGLCEELEFQGGLYVNCRKPDKCVGWDTVNSMQCNYVKVPAVASEPVVFDGEVIGYTEAVEESETSYYLGRSWEVL